ncbi:hypothetical protein D9M70_605470 [compost metagenome]
MIGGDVDHRAIGQGEAQAAVVIHRQAIGVAQGHGVGDLATFADAGAVHGQLGGDFVDGVSCFNGGRGIVDHQVLEGLAGHGGAGDVQG